MALTCKYTPKLYRYKGETKRCHCWPDLTTVHPAHRDCVSYPLYHFRETRAGQRALHSEKVAIKDGREDDLVDEHLGSQR